MTPFQYDHSNIEDDFLTVVTTSASAVVHRWLERGYSPSYNNPNLDYVKQLMNSSASVFEQCALDAVPLQCISDRLEYLNESSAQDGNRWLMLFAAALIFFMQAGFAMLCAGCVRIKNVGTFVQLLFSLFVFLLLYACLLHTMTVLHIITQSRGKIKLRANQPAVVQQVPFQKHYHQLLIS